MAAGANQCCSYTGLLMPALQAAHSPGCAACELPHHVTVTSANHLLLLGLQTFCLIS